MIRTHIKQKLFLAYIALLPFMKMPEFPVFGGKIQFCDILFAVFLLFFISEIVKKREQVKIPSFLTLLFLLATFLISTIFNFSDIKGIIEYIGIVYLAILYVVIPSFVKDTKYFWRCVDVWIYASSAVCIIGISGYIATFISGIDNFLTPPMNSISMTSWFPDFFQFHIRISSTFKTANMFASYLITSIAIIFLKIRSRIQKNKPYKLYIFILLLHLSSALLTKSRLIAPIFLLTALCMFSIYPRRYLFLKTSVAFASAILLILSFATLVIWVFPVQVSPFKINIKNSDYFILSQAALKMWKDHPVIGVGPGKYNEHLVEYMDWERAKATLPDPYSNCWKRKDPHSTYFGWAAETGLPGLVAILIFLFSNMRGAKIIKIGILAFLIAGFSIDIMTMRHFWFLMGLNIAYNKIVTAKKNDTDLEPML